ncbi:MAG: hypothetical protein PHY92_04520 [Alphaproteobacteria bacterium]|nr:hypothetical protein [Alphaproteobacteria bacterium]
MKTRLTDTDWSAYKSTAQTKTKSQTFKRTRINTTNDPRTSFDPTTIKVREARDSTNFPNSTPIIIAFDVTGSMGEIPYYFVKEGLGTLMKEIYDRKPVSDPQIMCMAVGDARCDRAPIQVTQFETDIRIAKQLEDLYLEGCGGGNHGESYNLPWYFAATKTSTDNFEKRGKKGLLFTIGDEPPVHELTRAQIEKFIGGEATRDYTSVELLEMARRQYDVYHVIIEQGSGLSDYGEQAVVGEWNKLLGEGYVLRLSDYTKLAEVVISAIQRNVGVDFDTIVKSWSGDTAMVVAKAMPVSPAPRGGKAARPHAVKLIEAQPAA